ncbi:polyhydroxyalkanoic acid system family protein [Magnetovibrio sp. PR-2]|uniref:polyhydroxyalkanoic acid system family protein n=1 Tax=Magnetovibrio sp. PR-2 TaxID=3120356 RepID=UPI002FCDF05C
MSEIKFQINHSLSVSDAVQRIEAALSSGSNGLDMLEDMKYVQKDAKFAFAAKAKGFKVSGALDVANESVAMSVKLPWAAKPFRKTAQSKIHAALQEILA